MQNKKNGETKSHKHTQCGEKKKRKKKEVSNTSFFKQFKLKKSVINTT